MRKFQIRATCRQIHVCGVPDSDLARLLIECGRSTGRLSTPSMISVSGIPSLCALSGTLTISPHDYPLLSRYHC